MRRRPSRPALPGGWYGKVGLHNQFHSDICSCRTGSTTLKQASVPAELHIYAGGGHGFGLRATNRGPLASWPARFQEWLADINLLSLKIEKKPETEQLKA